MFCFKRAPKYRVTGNCIARAMLSRRFSIATTNLLNRSVLSIPVSDVDSNFSLQLEDSEAEGENDEW